MSRLGARGISSSTLGNYSMVAGQAVRTLLVAGLLRPGDFGVLNLTNVLTNFSTYADVSTGVIGQQRASAARGSQRWTDADRELRDMAGARMVPALGLSLVLLLGAIVAWGVGSSRTATVLGFVALSAVLQSTWFSARGWLRVLGEFRLTMLAQLSQVLVWVTLVPLGAWTSGLLGALGALAISYLPPILVSARRVPLPALVTPRPRAFTMLVPAGIPMSLLLVTAFLLVNIEQLVVGAGLGDVALAIYGIAMLTANAVVAVSDGAAAAAHPQTLEAHARDGHLDVRTPSVTRVMRVVEAALGLVVPLSWVGMGVLTAVFLTEYEEALPVVAFVCAGASFVGTATASNAALLAVGLHRRVPRVTVVAILVKLVLASVVIVVGGPLWVVAALCVVGSAVYAVGYLRLVAQALGVDESWRFIGSHLPVPLTLVALATVSSWAHLEQGLIGFLIASAISVLVASGVGGLVLLRNRPVAR
ncbi:oligosaccharide flippase family protein [Janibacter sp. YIM B02568]|uniref:lipopolysaccharide biosynthesis protein n=1 Tax=Janibacter endophyticus TaxID=2806261 RepID=UPI00194E05D5|nr:oligosaccharide flippase family protein [Janibacter endophyticus]MBM6547007.1 oligosaccharide flippase family protein [Janibacter endophyticus]